MGVLGILLTGGISLVTFILDFMVFFPLALQRAATVNGVEISSSYFEILLNLNVYLNRVSLENVQFMIIGTFSLGILISIIIEYFLHKIEY